MSTAYELTGRTNQKARTRAALLQATRELLPTGVTPTVEQAADRAAVSRTTAYRYFRNQRALLIAAYPVLDMKSMLDREAPRDPETRLALAVERFTGLILQHEPELRAMLRLSLETPPAAADLPLRQGRAIRWIEDALSPLSGSLEKRELRRLVLAIRASCGIEALVWLCDVAKLPRDEARELMTWSARSLLRAALRHRPTRTVRR